MNITPDSNLQKNIYEYEAYIFDFDLTIADTLKTANTAYEYTFRRCNTVYDKNRIFHYLTVPLETTYNEMENPTLSFEEFRKLLYQKTHDIISETTELYPEIKRVIETLYASGKKIAIVTNRDKESIIRVLNKYGVTKFFHAIVGREDVVKQKPDKEPIEKCISLMGVHLSNALYFGDGINDYLAAIEAGIDFIYVDRYNKHLIEANLSMNDLSVLNNWEYDLFIAYHGTESEKGSSNKATDIANYLRSKGLSVFCHTLQTHVNFGEITLNAASNSRLFILVANGSIERDSRGRMTSRWINDELGYFKRAHSNSTEYVLSHSIIYAYDGMDAQSAEKLHNLFVGSAHIEEKSSNFSDLSYIEIANWVFRCLGADSHSNQMLVLNVIRSIAEDILNGKYVLVYGKGVSINEFKTNTEEVGEFALLKRIKELEPSIITNDIEMARSEYMQRKGKSAYIQDILKGFYINNLQGVSRSHTILSNLNFAGYVSLAHDNMLERALQAIGKNYEIISRSSDLRKWDLFGMEIPLFYLLGSLERDSDLYFIEDLKGRNDDLVTFIEVIFSQKKILFIGCDERDFQNVFNKYSKSMKQSGLISIVVYDTDDEEMIYSIDSSVGCIKMNHTKFLKLLYKVTYGGDISANDLTKIPNEIYDWVYDISGNPTETQAIDLFLSKIQGELREINQQNDTSIGIMIRNFNKAFKEIYSQKPHYIAFDTVYNKLIECCNQSNNKVKALKELIEDIQDERKLISKRISRKASIIIEDNISSKKIGLYGLSERVLDFLSGFDEQFQRISTVYIAECSVKNNSSYKDCFQYCREIGKRNLKFKVIIVSDITLMTLINNKKIDMLCFGIHAAFLIDDRIEVIRNICGTRYLAEIALSNNISAYFFSEQDKVVSNIRKNTFVPDVRIKETLPIIYIGGEIINIESIRNEEFEFKKGYYLVTDTKTYE